MMICNRDCFNCIYDDCINENMTVAESAEIERRNRSEYLKSDNIKARWNRENPKSIKEAKRKFYYSHLEDERKKRREYYYSNRERLLERNKSEMVKEYKREWARKYREKQRRKLNESRNNA